MTVVPARNHKHSQNLASYPQETVNAPQCCFQVHIVEGGNEGCTRIQICVSFRPQNNRQNTDRHSNRHLEKRNYMLHLVIGACLAGIVAFHGLSTKGSGWLIRHFQQSRRQRAMVVTAATGVLLLNVFCVAFHPTPFSSEVAAAITLILLAGIAVMLYHPVAGSGLQIGVRQTVLAVGAHPDDLELACGGTLAKLVDQGFDVQAVVMSHGQVGGDRAARPSEALAGGNYLGISTVEVLDLPDTLLGQHNMEMVQAIEAKIKAIAPVLVFTHSAHDHHQDHHAVHLATLRAARSHSSILCFESPSTTRGFNPSVYVDIEEYLDIKVRAVQLHRNQAGKPYMSASRVRGMASFRGSQAKREFAEGFEPVRLLATTPGVSL